MDGYAVCPGSTSMASNSKILKLRVVDTIAAGDGPNLKHCNEIRYQESAHVCVEIMTGARFPEKSLPCLDSVVKSEDVVCGEDWSDNESIASRYILLKNPVNPFQHRRPTGSDLRKGSVVIGKGDVIRPKHIGALASLGMVDIKVFDLVEQVSGQSINWPGRQLRIGVLSTGSEIIDSSRQVLQRSDKQRIPDSNGPYLVSSLKSAFPSAKVKYLGIAEDNEDALTERLMSAMAKDGLDVIITSGGVSSGRYDLVKDVVATRLQGRIVFHGAKIRPGAPVLFATIDAEAASWWNTSNRPVALFGAPGNPLAAAVTLRFFVLPYLFSFCSESERCLQHPQWTSDGEGDRWGSNLATCGGSTKVVVSGKCRRKPRDTTTFWLARHPTADARTVDILDDQASYKLSGILEADCWVVGPAGMDEVHPADELMAYSL